MNYLDTSALIKRFVAERGSALVRTLVKQMGPLATATIAYVEVYAALGRRRRQGDLADRSWALACRQFEDDWQAYLRVELRDEILRLARLLIEKHPLRGFDAVHLASAVSLKRALGEPVTFVAADARLLEAARAEGLGALDPESETSA